MRFLGSRPVSLFDGVCAMRRLIGRPTTISLTFVLAIILAFVPAAMMSAHATSLQNNSHAHTTMSPAGKIHAHGHESTNGSAGSAIHAEADHAGHKPAGTPNVVDPGASDRALCADMCLFSFVVPAREREFAPPTQSHSARTSIALRELAPELDQRPPRT